MGKQKRKLVHYKIMCLNDGTVISGYPARKPTPNIIKRDKISVDEDGGCHRWAYSGKELSDVENENRFRFQDIISNRLNTRRAIREIVMPELQKIQEELEGIRNSLGI